jgi:hypothetical protein
MLATNLKGEDDNNFIYLASSEPFELNNLMPVTFDYNEKVKDWKDIVYSTASIDFGEVNELTDDKPVLDYLLQESVGNWRKMLNERFGKKMLMEDFPLFY